MIVYSVSDTEEQPSCFRTKAEAVKYARQAAAYHDAGWEIEVHRHTTGPLTKALFVDAISHRGWSRGYTVVAKFPTTGKRED